MRLMMVVLTLAFLLAGCATTGTVPVPVPEKCKDAPIYNSSFKTSGLGETGLIIGWGSAITAINEATGKDCRPRFKGAAQRALQAARQGNLRAMGFALTSELGNWKEAANYRTMAMAAVLMLFKHYPDNQVIHPCDKEYLAGLCEDLVLLAS